MAQMLANTIHCPYAYMYQQGDMKALQGSKGVRGRAEVVEMM